jgi:hypothetical protein
MEAAANLLAALPAGDAPVLTPHVLTGRQFWFQTAFCLWTFARQAGRPLAPAIYDDGTLRPVDRDGLNRLFPTGRFVSHGEALAQLDEYLPEHRFPVLRDRWRHYPNIRKLIAPHLGQSGWKLVIDSDLLFFRRPELVLAWMERPNAPLHGVDDETSYGYSPELLESLAGAPLPPKLNVGLCGLKSEELDWPRIEQWCRILIEREGTHYYLEQALVAMLLAGRPSVVAPTHEYVTLPRPPEALACRAVMHHYVAESKRWYFQHNWRRALAQPGQVSA